jgi:hypothetical protein
MCGTRLMVVGWSLLAAVAACGEAEQNAELKRDADAAPALADAQDAVAPLSDARADSASVPDALPPPRGPLALVFAGESNSGGIALNSEATPAELAPRPAVQIMNLYSGTFGFEPLRIGFNNVVDHEGLSTNPIYVPMPPNGILVHGMELGLTNAVEAGLFPGEVKVGCRWRLLEQVSATDQQRQDRVAEQHSLGRLVFTRDQ